VFDSNALIHPAGSYSMTTNSASNAGNYIQHIMVPMTADTETCPGGGGTANTSSGLTTMGVGR
jgi:hypothetical protein